MTPTLAAGDSVSVEAPGPQWQRVLRDPETGTWIPLYVWMLVGGLLLQVTSGHSAEFLLPGPMDRALLLGGLLLFIVHPDLRDFRWRPRPILVAMGAIIVWWIASMIWHGSVDRRTAVFALVDAVGIGPFLLCLIAPVAFRTARRRQVLLLGLTLLGAYLGGVALLEGLNQYRFVWPGYIYDPTSDHWGRASGPSTQVANNGLQLLACAIGAAVLAVDRRVTSRLRMLCWLVSGLCLLGTVFTLTRSVWLGTMAGVGLALWTNRRLRLRLVLAGFGTLFAGAAGLFFATALRERMLERLGDESTAFDRVNANSAALDVVASHPWFGIGFQNFHALENGWLFQSDTIPIAATGIAVHNLWLGNAAELGIPGAVLWGVALFLAVIAVIRGIRSRPEREFGYWRQACLAYVIAYLVIGMLVPMTYAQPASFLWLFLGIAADPAALGWTLKATWAPIEISDTATESLVAVRAGRGGQS